MSHLTFEPLELFCECNFLGKINDWNLGCLLKYFNVSCFQLERKEWKGLWRRTRQFSNKVKRELLERFNNVVGFGNDWILTALVFLKLVSPDESLASMSNGPLNNSLVFPLKAPFLDNRSYQVSYTIIINKSSAASYILQAYSASLFSVPTR